MMDRKKGKKRKEEITTLEETVSDQPSKDEIVIAKWMRNNVPIKKTKFLNHNVEYFTASKAVDALMGSQWASYEDPMFTCREDVVELMNIMLLHKFFHRARKVPVSEQELKAKKKDKKKDGDSEDDKKKETDQATKGQEKAGTNAENTNTEGKKENNTVALWKEKDKKKRKIRLDMHNDQRFVDGLDAYVWIYDPIPFYYWICGTLIVLGVIGVCLFPLWPPTVRLGVYYLSIAAAGFLVFIIILAFLRLFIFCFVWLVTLGRHHIWILPNLTEDVGFFASFWPLYTYEYKGDKKPNKRSSSTKSKDKQSDDEGDDGKDKGDEDEKPSNEDQLPLETDLRQRKGKRKTGDDGAAQSESESESSQRSSTGKDFEIVDQDDIET